MDDDSDLDTSGGVLSGDAMSEFEKVREKVSPQGIGYDFITNCQNCNTPLAVTIPWAELIVASVPGGVPLNQENGQPWQIFKGFLYPSVFCRCGTIISLPLTPDKCERFVLTGIRMGKLNPAQVDQMRQNVQARLQQYRR